MMEAIDSEAFAVLVSWATLAFLIIPSISGGFCDD